ncbi:MAG: lysylphosphatidylglycerol synthase transmembrane domain-containing protein [Candidatus Binataceae bacterium]
MVEPLRRAEPATAAVAAPSKRNSYSGFALRVGLGLCVIGLLLWHYNARPILRTLEGERAGCFTLAIIIYLLGQALSAFRWQLLARMNSIRGRYAEFFSYTYIGMFTNLFVPGLIGGDAARAIYLGRRHQKMGPAVASVIADRAIGLLGLFWLGSACVMILGRVFSPSVFYSAMAIGVLTVIGWLALPLIARLLGTVGGRIGNFARPVLPYLRRPFKLIPAILLSLVLQLMLALAQYVLAIGLGLNISPLLFTACVPIANLLASLPITFNGLGVRETAYLVLLGMAGVSNEHAIALGLLWFASTMIAGLSGAVVFAMTETPALIGAREVATSD